MVASSSKILRIGFGISFVVSFVTVVHKINLQATMTRLHRREEPDWTSEDFIAGFLQKQTPKRKWKISENGEIVQAEEVDEGFRRIGKHTPLICDDDDLPVKGPHTIVVSLF